MNFLDHNAGHLRGNFFPPRVAHTTQRPPTEWPTLQSLLRDISIEPLANDSQIARAAGLLDEFHYLGAPNPVGERLWYVALGPGGGLLGVLLFTAAARRLRHRDEWIGWSDEQRRRRLPLVANNSRFLLLPDKTSPNFGCELVPDKSNEIPAARELIGRLDLDGKLVSLDALHSCQQTACQIVLEAGADYALTIKDNCSAIRERIEARLPDPGSPLLPWKNTPPAPPATAARKRNANG
jgi:predicted transposase YbfD/YdcC